MSDQKSNMDNTENTSHELPAEQGTSSQGGFGSWLRKIFTTGGDTSLRESLEDVIEHHAPSDAEFSDEERSMLFNILDFGNARVETVMVPRADIKAVEDIITIGELMQVFKEAEHSRLPVYGESLDDPKGMVHIKDLMGLIVSHTNGAGRIDEAMFERPLGKANIMRDLLYVPPSMQAVELLLKMQTTRLHMAAVIDEYGGTDGLVTIEDLVEEIVGEIEDEHDSDSGPLIKLQKDGTYLADARASIEELEEILDVDFFPEERDEDIDTLGGLVFAEAGQVPVRGELIKHESGIVFEILQADPRRIKKLRIHDSSDE